MNHETINLEWTELVSASEIEFPTEKKFGIYIWGFNIDNVFLPYYVGIADNIFSRIMEHLNSIISGKYVIYHSDSLKKFMDFKNQEVNREKTRGKIYSPNWPRGYITFINERKELQTHIDFMVDSFSFSYATVDQSKISKKELKEIEKICINQIGKENLQNTRSGFSTRFNINHYGESRVVDKMTKQTANKGS